MNTRIEGLVAAPVTPMNPDLSINLDLIEKQAEKLVQNGVSGAFVCGSTGESLSLITEERLKVARRWVEVAPEGFKVIVHTGSNSIEEGRILAGDAEQRGAWATAAMGPCFFKPESLTDLVAFCEEMAGSAPGLPFYYYHIPSLTGVFFPMLAFLEESAHRIPNLRGVKFTWENLMDFRLCCRVDQGRFEMLFGRDELLLCGLSMGARAAVGSTYNFAAPLYTRIIRAFDEGKMKAARDLQDKSQEMIHLMLNAGFSLVAVFKATMAMVGIDCGPVRPPLHNPSADQVKQLRKGLEEIGFFDFCSNDRSH